MSERGGFGRGRGKGDRGKGDRARGDRGRGDRGRGDRGRGDRARGDRRGRRDEGEKGWTPVTKLGRLVKEGKIRSLEEIYLHSLAVKEAEIIDFFLGAKLKDEVMKIKSVQKQTAAGQRTRFQACVAVGDFNGHIGIGMKCAKEVASSIRAAIILAKLSIVPVRRGYWGNRIGAPHTVANKVTGKCGSVQVRLIPAPRGTGLVAAPTSKKILAMAGIDDCYTASSGHTKTLGNFSKAVFAALSETYCYLAPDLWKPLPLTSNLYDEHSKFLSEGAKKL